MEICRDNCLKTFVTFALSLCDVGCINSCYQDVFKMNTDMIKNMRPFLDELWTLGQSVKLQSEYSNFDYYFMLSSKNDKTLTL